MNENEILTYFDLILKLIGIFGLLIALITLLFRKKADLFQIYTGVFAMVDNKDFREARDYVTRVMEKDTHSREKEDWNNPKILDEYKKNKMYADEVARGFDKLGLLVREGQIPLNIIARFYAYPILKCWLKLSVYIQQVRGSKDQDGRGQKGHRWEFENLVRIVVAGVKSDQVLWENVIDHDNL
jgi:hypothetical protein